MPPPSLPLFPPSLIHRCSHNTPGASVARAGPGQSGNRRLLTQKIPKSMELGRLPCRSSPALPCVQILGTCVKTGFLTMLPCVTQRSGQSSTTFEQTLVNAISLYGGIQTCRCLFQGSSSFSLHLESLINLELTISGRVARQLGLGIFLSLPPQTWDYRHFVPHQVKTSESQGSNSGSHAFIPRGSPTEPPPWTHSWGSLTVRVGCCTFKGFGQKSSWCLGSWWL